MRHLYSSRVEVLRPAEEIEDGLAQFTWRKVKAIIDPILGVPGEMMCRLDLAFQRPGKDQPMPVVAGRAPDRIGLMFCDPTTGLRSGDRLHCIDGPVVGTFELRVMPDPANTLNTVHHLEVQIVEVSQSMRPNIPLDGPYDVRV